MGLPCTLIYKHPVWIWNSTLHPTMDIHTFRACRGFRGQLEQLIHISRISGWITYLIAVSPDYHITLDSLCNRYDSQECKSSKAIIEKLGSHPLRDTRTWFSGMNLSQDEPINPDGFSYTFIYCTNAHMVGKTKVYDVMVQVIVASDGVGWFPLRRDWVVTVR